MVHEPELKSLLEDRERSLEQIGRTLIAAANDAGGRDNITVILFRLEDVDVGSGATARSEAAPTAEHDTVSDETESEHRRHGTVALQAVRPGEEEGGTAAPAREPPAGGEEVAEPPERTAPLPVEPRKGRRRRKRSGGALLLTLAIVLPHLVGAWLATRAVYFVGTDPAAGRSVTIYRGLPYELPLGIDLYETYYRSGVPLADVPAGRQQTFTDHKLRSRDDAEDLVIRLEKGQLE
jgi:protein phosphatase